LLRISCEPGRAPFLFLDLIRVPASGPPLRGVYGTFAGDGAPERLELSWTGNAAHWTVRTGR